MYLKSIKKFGCLFMVFGSSVGMMEIKPIDKPETQQINQETKSKILILNTLAKDSILSNNPALLSKIEEFLYTEEHKLRDMYSQEKIKLTLPADASDETRKQLIILYNLKEKWTPEAKDLIKSINVIKEQNGRTRLIVNTNEGDLELKAGYYQISGDHMYIKTTPTPGIYLISTDYDYNDQFNDWQFYKSEVLIPICNLSRKDLDKFDVNGRFNTFI